MIDFKNIVGHKNPIEILKNRIKYNKIGHSYLFIGKEGIGKKMTAIAFSKAVNCINLSKEQNPCNQCSSCLKIEKGMSADFNIVFPHNLTIKIDQIRELKNKIYFQPLENKKKIYIIDNADQMTIEAANSLLKILEDPPEYAIIILVTAFPDKILPTILSRCCQLLFKPLKIANQREVLRKKIPLEKEEKIENLIKLTYGNPGKAFNLVENQEKMKEYQQCIDILANMKPEETMDYIFSSEKMFGEVVNYFSSFTEMMVLWFRDILLFKIGAEREKIIFQDHINVLRHYAEYYSREKVIYILEYLVNIPEKMEIHINPRTLLENILIQLGDK
ncbi:MAG: DNA polymerase III subunit delta' [Atribacterota bacterium]